MAATETQTEVLGAGDLRAELTSIRPAHPALARLQRDLVQGAAAEQVITSYDRMHHRHNRS